MGCLKLDILNQHSLPLKVYSEGVNPLRVVYRDEQLKEKTVQRFISVDPIADQFPHVSTYNYAENEPIAHVDLWGLQAVWSAAHASRSPAAAKWAKENPKTAAAIASVPITMASGGILNYKNLSAAGFLVSSSIEVAASFITDSPVDLYDAAAGAGGPLFYAATTPLLDVKSDGSVSTAMDKDIEQLGFEIGANILGLGLGKAANALASKASSVGAKAQGFSNLAGNLPQSGINSQLSPSLLSSEASKLVGTQSLLSTLSSAAKVAGQGEDIVSKIVIKEKER